jgi:hypothetical protein
MTISAVVAVLVAALAVYALLTTGATHADSTYNPQTTVKFCNSFGTFAPDPLFNGGGGACSETAGLAAGANPDITTTLTEAQGDLNFTNVVTLAPNSQTIAAGGSMATGAKIGALHSDTTLGTFNNACNLTIGVDFILFNVALPNVPSDPRTSTNISYPQPEGTSDRFARWGTPGAGPIAVGGGNPVTYGVSPADQQAASTADGIQGYPKYLLDAFDPDFNALTKVDGAAKPIVPIAVYGGISKVTGTAIPLYFLQFGSGQLTALTDSPLRKLNASMGQPSVAVLNDPTEATNPSSISDFCTYLQTSTMLLGSPGGSARVTNPGAGTTQYFLQYNASFRDTDQDGYENSFDACPLNPNTGNGRNANAPGNGDSDSDGIDNSCDPLPDNPGISDQDGDGYQNRQDNCPLVSNGATAAPTGSPAPADIFQRESELSLANLPAADNGPGTDSMGDVCDSGTISVNQNNNNNAGSGPAPAPAISITMSPTVANGRTAANDADGDGYCTAQDAFDANIPHNAAKHNSWAGATHPALQMDTDGDKIFDTQETLMSQCATAYVPPAAPVPCAVGGAGSTTSYPAPPAVGVIPGYTLGSDSAKSCAQTTTAKDEGPWDNWGYDMNDDGIITGGDFLVMAAPYGKTVDQGLVNNTGNGQGWTAIYRYDLNGDGLISGGDFLAFSPVYGKTCGTGAPLSIPAFSQQ